MKSILLVSVMAIGFIACNDSGKKTTVSSIDSMNHEVHDAGKMTDTSSSTGKTMMSMMESMMNNMMAIQSSNSPDNDFASMMKAHHMGAIEMAQMEANQGTNPQIKQMAQKMIDDQQKEVAELNTFLSGHSAHGGGDGFHKEAKAIMNSMKMDMDHSGSIDKQFVEMMIPHHQSAIDMSKAYLRSGAHEQKLRTMASNIITSQQKEIEDLKSWLDKNE